MKTSILTYSVTRRYQYGWLTPVVIIGGVIALVAFSVLNFASQGYVLTVVYSNDPNATTAQDSFKHWPALVTSKIKPTCNAVNIPVDTQLLTNNTALTYTLSEVRQQASGGETYLSSLVYYNNFLQNCTVDWIQIDSGQYRRKAAQIAKSFFGVEVNANVVCRVETAVQGTVLVNLTATYDLLPITASVWGGSYRFIQRNKMNATSLYWGESMLSMFWGRFAMFMWSHSGEYLEDEDNYNGIIEITMYFTPNGTTHDISSRSFMGLDFRMPKGNVDGGFIVAWSGNPTQVDLPALEPHMAGYIPLFPGDDLAKAMYSTILTDLGQVEASPNILTKDNLLHHFTSGFESLPEEIFKRVGSIPVGPGLVQYDPSDTTNGPLEVHSSVLANNYLCQVPKRRPWSSLIIAILVSDLVFLQALWMIFTFVLGLVMVRKDPSTNFCEGCQQPLSSDSEGNKYVKIQTSTHENSDD